MIKTAAFTEIAPEISLNIRNALRCLNLLQYGEASRALRDVKDQISEAKLALCDSDSDETFNTIFVFGEYIDALSDYISFWDKLSRGEFSDSWTSLQDLQDRIRIVYRFIYAPRPKLLSHIERQCGYLEQLYPYTLFFSVGVILEKVECSICGRSADSFECIHIAGELYRGMLAHGIVKKIKHLDHVSVVTNPMDKRCVVTFEDSSTQFRLVAFLRDLIMGGKISPLGFSHLQWRKMRTPKNQFGRIGRNQPCTCGSGKKYKKCCVNKQTLEKDHVDIIGSKMGADDLQHGTTFYPSTVLGNLVQGRDDRVGFGVTPS